MANCFNSCLGCMSSVVLTLMRVILMIASVLILLGQIIGLYAIYYVDKNLVDVKFPGLEVHFTDYLVIVCAIVVSLVGIHGVYTKDPKYLKVFALILSFSAVLHLATGTDSISKEWRKHSQAFQDTMSEYAKDYQWNREPDEKLTTATKTWDLVQSSLLCCGLKGPKDWTQKWKQSQKNILPNTCCLRLTRAANLYPWMDGRCELQGAYAVGCLDRLDEMVESSASKVFIGALFQLVMACMALILAKQSESSQLSCAATNTTPQYQRFDGSVYVRQPSANQVNFTKQPPVAPSLYPNAHGIDHDEAPPKYVSHT